MEGGKAVSTFMKLLGDYTFQTVALGSALLGVVRGVLGCFAVLRKQSLLGDGVSHASLPGVALAFLLTGSKHTEVLLLGALFTGLLAMLFMVGIAHNSRIKFDGALALVMSVFFGLGMVLLTYAQKVPNANQAGLKRFIYGQASTLLQRDVVLMAVSGCVLLGIVMLLWKELKLLSFDPEFAGTLGYPVGKLNLLLSLLTVISIIMGLQTVGVVLMSAMLIAPAVAARQWTDKLWVMVLLASVFGAVSGVTGTLLSSAVPELPTGPVIAVCITGIAAVSLLVAPGRGILSRICMRHRACRKLREEEGEGV